MFEEKKSLLDFGTGSIEVQYVIIFKNKCKNIFASTTNLEKVSSKDTLLNLKN